MLEASSAVTVVTRNEAFWPVQNALVIVDASTESPVILPRVDACYRSTAPLVLNQAQEASFLTLLPGVPHVIVKSFRPFGPDVFDAAKIVAMGAARYRLAGKFGMQQLTVGREYLLTVEQGLLIVNWMFGTKEMLLAVEENEPNPVHIEGEPIPVIASGQAKFRIEP
ncbi:hypothetical protein MMC22_001030 [Lobaria immixta]|nr:hypothetical protein [Lobaria immixta]